MNKKMQLLTIGVGLLIPFGMALTTPSQVTVNAKVTSVKLTANDQKAERHWTKVMNKFAKQRANHYYPSISSNTRDLGGYKAKNGYRVKNDKIFRSKNLNAITEDGVKQLKALKIHKVIDLRSITEKEGIKDLPDPNEYHDQSNLDLGVKYYNYPTNTAKQKAKNKPFKEKYGQIYTYGKPFTDYKEARKSYHNIFKLALRNKNGAFLYHCLAGRDRTGLVSVVLLSALGVNKQTIYKDYLLTNYYRHKYPYVEQVKQLDHFYQTVNKSYGNMNNYLHKGIGLTTKQIDQFQKMYLTKK